MPGVVHDRYNMQSGPRLFGGVTQATLPIKTKKDPATHTHLVLQKQFVLKNRHYDVMIPCRNVENIHKVHTIYLARGPVRMKIQRETKQWAATVYDIKAPAVYRMVYMLP